MKKNPNFCRILCDGLEIEYAPYLFPPELHTPSKREYLKRGWKKNGIDKAMPPPGYYTSKKRYVLSEDGITVKAIYEYEKIPEVVKTRMFSRFEIYTALAQLGLWDKLENWMREKNVNNINAYTAFMVCNELADDNEVFKLFYQAAVSVLGLTEEQVLEILAHAEIK